MDTQELHDLAVDFGKAEHDRQFPNCKQNHKYKDA